MFWAKVWFGAASVMLILLIIVEAALQTFGLCFLAWCGGIVSTLAVQERQGRRQVQETKDVQD